MMTIFPLSLNAPMTHWQVSNIIFGTGATSAQTSYTLAGAGFTLSLAQVQSYHLLHSGRVIPVSESGSTVEVLLPCRGEPKIRTKEAMALMNTHAPEASGAVLVRGHIDSLEREINQSLEFGNLDSFIDAAQRIANFVLMDSLTSGLSAENRISLYRGIRRIVWKCDLRRINVGKLDPVVRFARKTFKWWQEGNCYDLDKLLRDLIVNDTRRSEPDPKVSVIYSLGEAISQAVVPHRCVAQHPPASRITPAADPAVLFQLLLDTNDALVVSSETLVLAALTLFGPLKDSQLADHIGHDVNGVPINAVLRTMKRNGLVETSTPRSRGTLKQISLTTEGKERGRSIIVFLKKAGVP